MPSTGKGRNSSKRAVPSSSPDTDFGMNMSYKKRVLDSDSYGQLGSVSIPLITAEIPEWFNKRSSQKQNSPTDPNPNELNPSTDTPTTKKKATRAAIGKKTNDQIDNDKATTERSTDDSASTSKPPVSALEAKRAKKAAVAAVEPITPPTTLTPSDESTQASQVTTKPKSAVEARRAKQAATDESTTTARPMSALEARRAKKTTAHTAETDGVLTTMDPDRLPTRIYNSPSPRSPPMSDQEDAEFGTPMDLSEDESTIVEEKKDQGVEKNRLKDLTKLLDPNSVSTYSAKNVVTFEHEGETCYCIGFEKDEKLVFIGHVLIGSLTGSVDMNGATISSHLSQPDDDTPHTLSFFPVFSPRTSPLMVVRSIPYETSTCKSSATLDSTFTDLGTVLEPLKSRWDTFESVVVIKSLEWCGADQLETILPAFRNLFCLKDADDSDIKGFQPIVKTTPEVRALQIDPSWTLGIDNVLNYEQDQSVPSVSMICGTKNAGKSLFARYMVNRLMKSHQRVAYLETDVGQTEFSPSGLVSLHIVDTPLLGPPFTHPNLKCTRSFYVGSTTPKADPTYYLDCIHELVQVYREEAVKWMSCPDDENQFYHSLPLVINTNGWVKGLGYDILFSLMDDVAPTHVFGFGCTPTDRHGLPLDFAARTLSRDENRRLIKLETPVAVFNQDQAREIFSLRHNQYRVLPTTLSDKYTAADLRQLMFVSYMYHDAHTFGTKATWWRTNLRLVDRLPWTIDWRHHLKGVWLLFDDVPSSQLLYALNGSMVGLVGATDDDDHTTSETGNEKIAPNYCSPMTSAPPNPSTTTCHGVGIIRCIDAEQHLIHLLTPIPIEELRQVTRLVKGDIDLPIACLFDQQGGAGNHICGIPRRLVPYVSQDVINTIGSGTSVVRRNIMRRSQQN